MKKLIFSLLFLIISNLHFSQNFTKNDYLEDLKYLEDTLTSKHKNLFNKINQQKFSYLINQIEAKTDTLSFDTFFIELSKLIKKVGDEHTSLRLPYNDQFPVKFEKFKEGIFITEIDSTYSYLLYSKLIGINNQSIDEVLFKCTEIINNENPSFFDTYFTYLLNNPFYLKGLKITSELTKAEYILENKNGKKIKLQLHSTGKKRNKGKMIVAEKYKELYNLSEKNKYYYYQYNPVHNIVYFNYLTCRENPNYSFKLFNKNLFSLIQQRQPDKIIIDLRYNRGGGSSLLAPFINNIKKSYLNNTQKLYVLISKYTFSSAVMNAVELMKNTKTIVVGETSGGNINHFGEVKNFLLPKTKITVNYSTKYWENWKSKKGGIQPDVSIQYSIINFKANNDEALEYIYNDQ